MRTLLYSDPAPTSSATTHVSVASSPENQPLTLDSDLVVILGALICALICVIGLALVVRCSCLHRNTARNSSSPSAKSISNKGLNKKDIKSLPKSIFREEGEEESRRASSSDAVECAICLERFGEGEEVRVLPGCGHGFHVMCVDKWLESHSSCPSCRRVLVVGPRKCRKCGADVLAKPPRLEDGFLP